MAPRANWKGFLRLSLVTCPVALYPATSESEKVSFNQLNRKTGHRIKYAKVDADTGEEVANEDIVKGYKIDTDTFVEVTKEELEEVALESTRTIEIDEFVEKSEIDPRYLIRPYYLRPDGKVGHDAFAVIRETIREMNKVAIGRVVLTNREHIIALEPLDKGLMGTLLRYPYEVRIRGGVFRRDPGRQSHQGHARPRQAHREPEVGQLRAGQVRGPLRDRARRPDQPEARRQADHAEGTAARRERRRSDGRAAQERRRRHGGYQGSEESRQETTEGRGRAEGNADADRRQEAGEGDRREEAGGQVAAEVGVVAPNFRSMRRSTACLPTCCLGTLRLPYERAGQILGCAPSNSSPAPQGLPPNLFLSSVQHPTFSGLIPDTTGGIPTPRPRAFSLDLKVNFISFALKSLSHAHVRSKIYMSSFCRHLIHYELDPSPVRTLQRNGRVRRVGSWAALTGRPICYAYPTFGGTRDEKAGGHHATAHPGVRITARWCTFPR